jgi:hypothetical protein
MAGEAESSVGEAGSGGEARGQRGEEATGGGFAMGEDGFAGVDDGRKRGGDRGCFPSVKKGKGGFA